MMRRPLLLFVLLLVFVNVAGCSSLPDRIPETMRAACDLLTTAKPLVVDARKFAADNWDAIPADKQAMLLELDHLLPQIENARVLLCLGADAATAARVGSVDWDKALSTLLRGVSFAVDLKRRGAI